MLGHRITVSLPHVSGLPRDAVVNTFHTVGTTDAEATAFADVALANFYNSANTGGGFANPIANYISEVISRAANAVTARVYQVPDARADLGSPIHTGHWTLGATAATDRPYPEECCIVVTLAGSLVGINESGPSEAIPTPRSAIAMGAPATHDGTPKLRARHRGRLFLGPLNSASQLNDFSGGIKIDTRAADDIIVAAVRLQSATPAGVGGKWAVFSNRDWAMRQIQTCTVDNAYDTQRRRGPLAGLRRGSVSNVLAP